MTASLQRSAAPVRPSGSPVRRRSRVVACYLILAALVVPAALADPDLPGPASSLESIPAGSLVIAMDNDKQNLGGAPFNLKAYGLVTRLLWNEIPVKWAIRAGKAKDGIDFTAEARRVLPSASASAPLDFRAGPFIVHQTYAAAALEQATAYGQSVAVYELTTDATVDVRYTLLHKPKVAVFDDGGNEGIHIAALDAGGFVSGQHYAALGAATLATINANACYTLGSEAHWDNPAADPQVQAVRQFVQSGANFLAQCVATLTYENNPAHGHFQTTGGLIDGDTSSSFDYPFPDLPYSQFQGTLADVGGSVSEWVLAAGSSWANGAHIHARPTLAVDRAHASVAKLVPGTGGLVHYLGGHAYGASALGDINGYRMYLNAALTPALRPPPCGLNFTLTPEIGGTVYEDVNGDGSLADGVRRPGVTVRLYRDAGDGNPDGSDPLVATTTTDAAGYYLFTNLSPGTRYWVQVDSVSVTPSVPFVAAQLPAQVWAEQTHGPRGARCDDGTGGESELGAAGPCHGGRHADVSDGPATLPGSEHVAVVTVSNGVRTVDFGFGFAVVTNTRDGDEDAALSPRSIQGSLRQFLLNSNAITGAQSSVFRIPSSSSGFDGRSWRIAPTTDLPELVDALVLDGSTQTGFSGSPLIEIDGSAGQAGIVVSGGASTVRGLVVNRFNGAGIELTSAGGNRIQGNYIGTDATGTQDRGNQREGIRIASPNNVVGGATAATRNVISANQREGLKIDNPGTGNVIEGNYIGTDATGTLALPNGSGGINLGTADNRIGGPGPGERNVVSGNAREGIRVRNASGNLLQGNYIGTNSSGTGALGNAGDGVLILGLQTTVGGTVAGSVNTIAYNGGAGVNLQGNNALENSVRRNSIFSNGALGIDLDDDGITPNDVLDADTGPNLLQNYPVLALVEPDGDTTGTLRGLPGTTFQIDFYASAAMDPTGYGEGQHYVASTAVTTDAAGLASFSLRLTLPAGAPFVTATATAPDGATSEFSFASSPLALSGSVLEDRNGDGDLADAAGRGNAAVSVFRDGGDGQPDGVDDTLKETVLTANDGAYLVGGLVTGTYWVRVDSTTVSSVSGVNGGHTRAETWAEQTWGPAGAWCETGSGTAPRGTAGTCYGGKRAHITDAPSSLGTSEHLAQVVVGATDVKGVDFGFSFVVVVNTIDNVGVVPVQGSLRQFLGNSNALGGTATSVFRIPTGDPGYGDGGPGIYTIAPRSPLPDVTDPVTLDATSQPGFSGRPIVELNGNNAGPGDGLRLLAGASTVSGFAIDEFDGDGIEIAVQGQNVVAGNLIGTDAVGGTAKANDGHGIQIVDSDKNRIGGTAAADGNVISGNKLSGVRIAGSGADDNVVAGNVIGLAADGQAALANLVDGVVVAAGAKTNVIGGAVPAARNVVSGNRGAGVRIDGVDTVKNAIHGNYIGTDAGGSVARPNLAGGVIVGGGATGNFVGGTLAGERNVVSGNAIGGILVTGATTADNSVIGNLVGTSATGAARLGNAGHGVSIDDAPDTVLSDNTVAGSARSGIYLSAAVGTTILGNSVGTNGTLASGLGNTDHGILIDDSKGSIVGGTDSGESNAIWHNGRAGVAVVGTGTGNRISGNSIEANDQLGIDLRADGVTNNDALDTDSGANDLQNYPWLVYAISTGDSTQVTGSFASAPSTDYDLEFFLLDTPDPSGFGEGRTLLGTGKVTTDAAGDGSFSLLFDVRSASGQAVAATATNPVGSTSEFSGPTPVLARNCNLFADQDTFLDRVLPTDTHGADNTLLVGALAADDKRALFRYDLSIIPPGSTIQSAEAWYFAKDADGQVVRLYRVTNNWSEATANWNNTNGDFDAGTVWGSIATIDKDTFVSTDLTALVQGWVDGTYANHGVLLRANDNKKVKLASRESGRLPERPCIEAVFTPPGGWSISGSVVEDRDGDGDPDQTGPLAGVTVLAYLDDGDGAPDGADTPAGSTTTSSSGAYSIDGLSGGDYWIAVDSRSIAPPTALNAGFTAADAWAEQTFGPPGALCDDGVGATRSLTAAGPCPGGKAADSSDAATSLAASEHVAFARLGSTQVTAADFGFAFNTIVTARDGDDEPGSRSVQGSLRQVIQNANAIGGPDAAAFALSTSTAGWNGTTFRIAPTGPLPEIAEALALDATTQPGFSGAPIVELHGAAAGSADGLVVGGQNSRIRGFTINGFEGHGIVLRSQNNRVEGNQIGTDASGTGPLGNTRAGVYVKDVGPNLIGGAGAANRIAYNGGAGVEVAGAAVGNTVTRNAIHDNAALGIDLGGDGATPNDPGDPDTGPNELQNRPELTAAVYDGASTVVSGSVDGPPGTGLVLEFFSSPAPDPTGFGEGAVFLDAVTVTTDATGRASFARALAVAPGEAVSATATSPLGSTSEFAAVVFAAAPPDLALSKAVDDATPAVGSDVTFTLTLNNAASAGPATGVVVEDVLPDGYRFVGSAGDGAYDEATGHWSVSSVAPGASVSIDITARVLGSGARLNVAEVIKADQSDADDTYGDGAGEDFATASTAPVPTVDLALAKVVDVAAPAVGTEVAFTLTLSNAADYSPASNVVVIDLLPSGYAFVGASGDGAYDEASGTWTVPALAPGTAASLVVRTRVLGAGGYVNAAEVTAAGEPDTDDTYSDGVGEDFATASTTPAASVDLALTKDVDDAAPVVGRNVTFTLTLANAAGASAATNVVVSDPLPSGYTFISATGDGVYDAPSGAWTLPALPAGGSASMAITVEVLAGGPHDNVAEVIAADQPDADDTYADGAGEDFATASTTPVPTVDLSLTKGVDDATPVVGQTVTFTLTLSNASGGITATNVVVRDSPQAGYQFVGAAGDGTYDPVSGAWSVPSLAAGATASLAITMEVLSPGPYGNVAEVVTADQPDLDDTYGDGDGEDHATAATTPIGTIDLVLSKSVDDASPLVGTNVVFTLTLSNAPIAGVATNVVVQDALPAGYAFVAASGNGTYDAVGGAWSVATLAAGGTASMAITAQVLAAGNYANVAEVLAADQPDANDVFGDGVGDDYATASTSPIHPIDLALAKTVDVATPAVGSTVTFTLALSNASGSGDATDVVVLDPLPGGYVFVGAAGDGAYDPISGAWSVPSLPAGATATLAVTARVLATGPYDNVAEVVAAGQPDLDDTFGDGAGEDWALRPTVPVATVDLGLVKSVDDPTPLAGANVVFTLGVSNAAGTSDATGVVVHDLLPSGYAFVAAAGDGAYDPASGAWSVGSVPAGSTASIAITAQVLGTGDWVNVAEVTAADQPDLDDTYGDGAGEDRATAATMPRLPSDVALAKTVDVASPAVTSTVTFTLVLSNAPGSGEATNVVVQDALPAGYAFVGATGDGAYDPISGAWSVPSLPAGAMATLAITARVLATGPYDNVAEVVAADQPDLDDTFGDGTGEDWALRPTVPVATVDLGLVKSVDDPTPLAGANVVFTLGVSNAAGTSDATGVVVRDLLPSGYAFVGAAGDGAYDPASGAWSVGSVLAGSTASIAISAQVLATGSWVNAAEVIAADQPDLDDTYGDGAGEDHASAATTPVLPPDLALSKVVDVANPPVGTTVTFTLALSNAAGLGDATNVVVLDVLPGGYAFVGATGDGTYDLPSGPWRVASLPAGATATIAITARVLAAGPYDNVAEVVSADQPDLDDTFGDGTGEDWALQSTAPVATVDLGLVKSVDNPAPPVGANVVFTLSVSNAAGTSDATGVVVRDQLPSGYAFVAAAGDGAYDPASGTWNVASLPAGATATIAITARVLGTGNWVNAAEVIAADQPDADDTYGDGAGDDFATAATTPLLPPDLALSKTVDVAAPAVGSTVTFTLALSNAAGAGEATNVVVLDALPGGYAFVGATGEGTYDLPSGQWRVASLPAGATATIAITARVLAAGPYDNVAEVVSADQPDLDDTFGDGGGEDWASATVVPTAMVDLQLEKSVDNPRPQVSNDVTFTLSVSNATGYSDATSLEIADHLPTGYSFVAATGDGSYDPVTGMWTLPAVAAGGQASLQIRATVLEAGNFVNETEVMAADQPDADDTFADGSGEDWASAETAPSLDALRLVKTASTNEVLVGDLVGYTIRVENILASAVNGVVLTDLLPPGFKYVEDTARLTLPGLDNQLGTMDDVVQNLAVTGGRPVEFGPFDVAALATVEVSYLLRVGSGVVPGEYSNSVLPHSGVLTVGNTAAATVTVVIDPLFDLSTIIGKVFEDLDGDELQGPDEPGVAGAMVALDDGTYALTDAHGRYHFPAVRPGQRLVKLNVRSLPTGSEATTDPLRVLWVTPGLMVRADFGVRGVTDSVESIGEPGQAGLGVTARVERDPVLIVGSLESFAVWVNDRGLDLPSVDVRIQGQGLADVVEFQGRGPDQPIAFDPHVDAPEQARAWSLAIFSGAGTPLRTLRGDGPPPARVDWDGRSEDGEPVAAGEIYQYQLDVDYGSAHVASARRLFGVNRKSVVAFQLTGDAFGVGQSDLSEQARFALREAATTLAQHPDEPVVVEGHTDDTGSAAANLELSRRRAEAARDYLVREHGISAARLALRWYGEERPIASNDLPEGRELNRRVEIKADIAEVDAARLADGYRATPSVRVGTVAPAVEDQGRFRATVDTAATDGLEIELQDAQGRLVRTSVAVPSFEITRPVGDEVVGLASAQGACNAVGAESVGLPNAEPDGEANGHAEDNTAGGFLCRLEGRTAPGNTLSIDGRSIDVGADGGFAADVALGRGDNVLGVLVRDPRGLAQSGLVSVRLSDRDAEGRPYSLGGGVPNLDVTLPPRGVALSSNELRVAGTTDPGNRVSVNGTAVEVRADGTFDTSTRLPAGASSLVVDVEDPQGGTGRIEREVEVPGTQLFLVAFADGKVSQLQGSGYIEAAGLGPQDVDELYVDGRLAFYLKGVIAGKYLITSSYDSARDEAEYLFRNLDAGQTDRLLRNLDPDRFYPVYGDESSVVFDAETRGKFYLALEGEALTALVGSYPLALTQTELSSYQRTLYGGRVAYESVSRTRFGAPDTQVVVFAAEQDQTHVSDELRATGGSLYYLSHRDVIEGSEQVTVVVRDKHSGLVLERRVQRQNLDYTIKYPEGRVMFHRPLSSVVAGGTLVNEEILGGNPVYVLVEYEARAAGLDEVAAGGRVRQQVGDRVALGATYVSDTLQQGEYELGGVDAEVRLREHTRIVAEYAESTGSDAQKFVSEDGGLTYAETSATGALDGAAWKTALDVDLGEWFGKPEKHRVSVYFKELDPGFFSAGNFQEQGSRKSGLQGSFRLGERDSLLVRHDRVEQLGDAVTGPPAPGAASESVISSVQWEHRKERWGFNVEYFDNRTEDVLGTALQESRLAAARYWFQPLEKLTARIEHQQTLSGTDNDQTTLGAQYQVLPSLALDVQATDGDRGSSAQAGAVLSVGPAEIYLTERQAADAGGERTSTILGARSPIGESSRVYTEYQLEDSAHGDRAISLVGVQRQWDVSEGLRVLLAGEAANVDADGADTKRTALSGGLTYGRKNLQAVTRNDVRWESGAASRMQVVTFNQVDYKLGEDFTLLGKWRYSKTHERDTAAVDARFEERSVGVAYRPVAHDRFNALGRYTRLADLDPVAASRGPRADRTSDVLSIDTAFQATRRLEWLAKAAFRFQTERFAGLPEQESETYLMIQRVNWNAYRTVDVAAEYRILGEREADDRRQGWLAEVGWRLQRHVRLGLGYNFTDFSDNLLSQNDYSVRGWYFRIQGLY